MEGIVLFGLSVFCEYGIAAASFEEDMELGGGHVAGVDLFFVASVVLVRVCFGKDLGDKESWEGGDGGGGGEMMIGLFDDEGKVHFLGCG